MTLAMNEFKKALEEKNIPTILNLIKKQPRILIYQWCDKQGNSAFHIVASKGTTVQFKELMKSAMSVPIDKHGRNSNGETPLHCAIKNLEMVNCLLKFNAPITLADNDGNLPLHLAVKEGLAGVTDRLCDEIKVRNASYDKSFIPAILLEPKFNIGTKNKANQSATPYPGGLRKRWKMSDKTILEWDYQHGEVEMYDKRGNHLGAYDQNTGKQIKGPKSDRNIKKYL